MFFMLSISEDLPVSALETLETFRKNGSVSKDSVYLPIYYLIAEMGTLRIRHIVVEKKERQ